MKKHRLFFLLLIIITIAFTTTHKYYVSITNIDYIEEKKSVQIITRLFIDDFEKLLQERYNNNILLATNQDEETIDNYIKNYLLLKLNIEINNTKATINYLGKEYEEDVVQCYLEIENISEIKSIKIKNETLFDMFSDQKNIIRTHINQKHKSFILNKEDKTRMLNF